MRSWSAALVCLLLFSGCVASTEVKQASSQLGVALGELRAAQDDLRETYLRELEETRRIAARAIVADAVLQKVSEMSAAELEGDLIALSSAIKSEREAYRDLVAEILAAEPRAGESDEEVVDRVLASRAADLRRSADALEQIGESASAAELRERGEQLEAGEGGIDQYGDMLTLVTLARTKADVSAGIADLDAYLRFLQVIHAQVHEWVSTDVTVSGSDMAALIERAGAMTGDPEGGGR